MQKKTKKHIKKAVKKVGLKKLVLTLIIAVTLLVVAVAIAYNYNNSFKLMVDNYISTLFYNDTVPTDDPHNNQNNGNQDQNNGNQDIVYGELIVHFIDVGQGDAIFICFPDGKYMLIDGGNNGYWLDKQVSEEEYDARLKSYLSLKLEDNIFIDYLMLTHPDADHVGNLDDVLLEYEVGAIYMPKLIGNYRDADGDVVPAATREVELGTHSTRTYYEFYSLAMIETYTIDDVVYNTEIIYNIDILYIEGEDYSLTIYCPSESYYSGFNYKSGNPSIPGTHSEDKNNMSPIVIMEYAGVKVAFTGDADTWAENNFMSLAGDAIDVDVLKVAHHGSKGASNQNFLDFITPEYSVISVGENNSYGHPHQEALDRLSSTTIYRTDIHGDVTLTIKGDGSFNFTVEKDAA